MFSKIDIYVVKKRIANLMDDLYNYERAIENVTFLELSLKKDLELIEKEMEEK